MWGNTRGWVLSAMMALVLGWLLVLGALPPKPSEPSGAFPNLLAKVQLPTDPKSVVPLMSEECDAGEVYGRVLQEYKANRATYEKYRAKPTEAKAANPRAVELLHEAKKCSRMSFFSRRPQELLNYNPDLPEMEALEKIGGLANQLGLLYRLDKKPDEARRQFEAMFALGYHLYGERLSWAEFVAGVNLMADAARGLAKLEKDAGNEDRARTLEEFAKSSDDYKLKQFEVYKVVSSIDTTTVGRHGGDILALARHSPEPMWRGEAILSLGRMKFNTPHKGDQAAARREVKQWVQDPHPAVRTAAVEADNLTLDKYRTLR